MLVLGFPEYPEQAERLATALDCDCKIVDIHRFPDGESRVRLPEELPRQVVLCRSLNQPNDKLLELMLASATARELGAGELTLVAPYLCYMRQDKAFVPGDAVSQAIVGKWLGGLFDRVVTVDPHLHRTRTLEQVVPNARAVTLNAAPLMAEHLKRMTDDPFLIGPDSEAQQWVGRLAELSGAPYAVAAKHRRGDRDVRVELPEHGCSGRTAVIVDDIVSTGETMAAAVRIARARGARSVDCLVTHALFCEGALELLKSAGASRILSTDSVRHASNEIQLAALLSKGVCSAPEIRRGA
jgi:ribose-phosphate pyrophosphokinase